MTSLQSVPCHNAGMGSGIVLLEEKIVSNSPVDRQDMWIKDFIHIALACKCAQITTKSVWLSVQSKETIKLSYYTMLKVVLILFLTLVCDINTTLKSRFLHENNKYLTFSRLKLTVPTKNNFLISQPKHLLWVLKRIV